MIGTMQLTVYLLTFEYGEPLADSRGRALSCDGCVFLALAKRDAAYALSEDSPCFECWHLDLLYGYRPYWTAGPGVPGGGLSDGAPPDSMLAS
jgi:hypothetical protein